jgi:hypothetical protein
MLERSQHIHFEQSRGICEVFQFFASEQQAQIFLLFILG